MIDRRAFLQSIAAFVGVAALPSAAVEQFARSGAHAVVPLRLPSDFVIERILFSYDGQALPLTFDAPLVLERGKTLFVRAAEDDRVQLYVDRAMLVDLPPRHLQAIARCRGYFPVPCDQSGVTVYGWRVGEDGARYELHSFRSQCSGPEELGP